MRTSNDLTHFSIAMAPVEASMLGFFAPMRSGSFYSQDASTGMSDQQMSEEILVVVTRAPVQITSSVKRPTETHPSFSSRRIR